MTTISLKMIEVLQAIPALRNVTTQVIPAKYSFRLSFITDEVDRCAKAFNDAKSKLTGGKPELTDDEAKEFDGLLNETVELNIKKISLDALDTLKLSTEDMRFIRWIFEEENHGPA